MKTHSPETRIHFTMDNGLDIAVHEAEGLRWLDFGDGGIQSVIDLSDPDRLVSALNQAMLAGLLFVPSPQRALLLGTGGGAIARFLSRRAPDCKGEAVEQSTVVAEIARQFFDFPDTESGWTLHTVEAREFISRSRQRYDLIVLDIAENQHTPGWVRNMDFLDSCRQRLTPEGVLALNLLPRDATDFTRTLAPIRESFTGCTACLSLPEQRNILVLAFRHPVSTAGVKNRIPALEQHWGLPFAAFLQRMYNDNPPGSGVF